MIKGILFDKDGTLIDFQEVWGPAARPATERLLQSCGVREVGARTEEALERMGVCGGRIGAEADFAWMSWQGLTDVIYELTIPEPETGREALPKAKVQRLMTDAFYQEVAEKRETYPVFTDVARLFARLTSGGIRVGLATTDTEMSARSCLRRLGAERYVTFWGTAGEGLPEKPDGELLRLAASYWEILPEEIAVVGDTPGDMRFAHSEGAFAIGVLSGTGTRLQLQPLADVILGSVAELEEWIFRYRQKERIDKWLRSS